jgi:hypothetical protein
MALEQPPPHVAHADRVRVTAESRVGTDGEMRIEEKKQRAKEARSQRGTDKGTDKGGKR